MFIVRTSSLENNLGSFFEKLAKPQKLNSVKSTSVWRNLIEILGEYQVRAYCDSSEILCLEIYACKHALFRSLTSKTFFSFGKTVGNQTRKNQFLK